MQGGQAIWRKRSPVLSACQALVKQEMTAIRYGGVVRNNVVTLSLPRPFMTLRIQIQPKTNLLRIVNTNVGNRVVIDPLAVLP